MQVINYLKKNGLDSLKEFGIKTCFHEDGRIILNYNQIDSPKFHPIVDECRGLCLDSNFDLVARSFSRFYNIGERKEEFNYSDCISTTKLDGSLNIIYTYGDKVHLNTRGSFGGEVGSYPITWENLLGQAEPFWRDKFKGGLTFVGEICSKYNRVVIPYNEPKFYLLSVFDGEEELSPSQVKDIGDDLGLNMPDTYYFSSPKEVVEYVEAQDGKGFEGLVLRSKNDRIKVKNSTYVKLHHCFSNNALVHPNTLVPLILRGESAEVISYFPEFKQQIEEIENLLSKLYQELDNLYFCFWNEPSQKKFAQSIIHHPLSGLLFEARKHKKTFIEVWRESERILLDYVKTLLRR